MTVVHSPICTVERILCNAYRELQGRELMRWAWHMFVVVDLQTHQFSLSCVLPPWREHQWILGIRKQQTQNTSVLLCVRRRFQGEKLVMEQRSLMQPSWNMPPNWPTIQDFGPLNFGVVWYTENLVYVSSVNIHLWRKQHEASPAAPSQTQPRIPLDIVAIL